MARKITSRDYDHVSEYIVDELDKRRGKRKSLDYQIKEIDRQVEMIPDCSHKMMIGQNGVPTNQRDPNKAWLPEIELPLQAEALETLTSDARSMQFPDTGPWFRANAAMTDEYLKRADFKSIIAGDENEVPSQINQDNADKLVHGYLSHLMRQYDFRGHMDVINAEAISYGTGIGRARMVTHPIFAETAQGVTSTKKRFPVLIPRSLKETFLDDREHILMHEGYKVGPMTMFHRNMTLKDLQIRAQGSNDPEKEDGGWIAKNVDKLESDKDGLVQLIEAEGDFVIPRKTTGDIFLPGTIFTVAVGKNAKHIVRVQFRQYPFDSVLVFPYHKEKVESPYSASPLRKGRPLQAAAVEALMRLCEVSALNARPPVGYDRSDMSFGQSGGPIIEPGRLWPTLGEITVHKFGDVAALFNVYAGFLIQYADAVGIHAARLGAQTLSHTTAYAKGVELQRGAVRTVDYVRSTLQGPLTKWLYMCYEMGRKNFSGDETFFIDAYRGYVNIGKEHLPDLVTFEAHGSGGPAEEQQKKADKLAALQYARQIDLEGIQLGDTPKLNTTAIIRDVLTEGGWTDVDPYLINTDQQAPQISPEMLAAATGAA